MSKSSSKKDAVAITVDKLKKIANKVKGKDRPYVIMGATVKDGMCDYSYEIISGIGIGGTHTVKKTAGIVDDDLLTALSKFSVHLAVVDGSFKYSGIEIDDIDSFHTHEITHNYIVTQFKIAGGKDNESIQLIGNKYVSEAGGRMELTTPKIPLDNLSSYKWYNELKDAAAYAREEVSLYKEGKYTPIEVDEEEDDPAQGTLYDKQTDDSFDQDLANAAM